MIVAAAPREAFHTEIVPADVPGGPSTSQTIMVSSLQRVLSLLPPDAPRGAYRSAVMEENVLAKDTTSGREWAFRQLRRFYGPRSSLRSETTFSQQPLPNLGALIRAVDSFVVVWAASEPYEKYLVPYAFRVALQSRAYREALILEETPIERLLEVGPWLPRHPPQLPATTSPPGDNDSYDSADEEAHQQERELVLHALADPSWDFRSVDGLARATGLSLERVRLAVSELERLGRVRRPLVPDPQGRELWTLSTRRPRWRERYMSFRSRVATW